jgi:hypothetical protein
MFDGKIFMGYRQKFNILVVMFLVAGVFANSSLAEVCFCGQACLHGSQSKSKINFTFHMRCPGTFCKSCNLEESLTLKATNPVTHFFELKSLVVAFIPPPVNDYLFTGGIPKVSQFIQIVLTVPSLPLYLQNLTFLC